MSPPTMHERRQKQAHWGAVQEAVVPDWARSLNTRKEKAVERAARHNRSFTERGSLGASMRESARTALEPIRRRI
jgi:hypothetical protein